MATRSSTPAALSDGTALDGLPHSQLWTGGTDETPPLSTYLFALAVGPLQATAPRRVGRTPVRVWHVPGKAHLAAFGVEAGAELLSDAGP